MATKKTTPKGTPKACPPTFDQAPADVQALVMKAAGIREAACYAEIKDKLQAILGMNKEQLKQHRELMRGHFQKAAILIFNERAYGADSWDIWLKYLIRVCLKNDQVQA